MFLLQCREANGFVVGFLYSSRNGRLETLSELTDVAKGRLQPGFGAVSLKWRLSKFPLFFVQHQFAVPEQKVGPE